MFISIAHATEAVAATEPEVADMFWTNMGLIGLMFVLFYFLMIRPQQKRMQQQRDMLGGLQKGDQVITGGGLVGKISKIISDDQVEVDLGPVKVTAMRYTLQTQLSTSAIDTAKPVNDSKSDDKIDEEKAAPKKKPAARKKSSSSKKKA